MNKFNIGDQVKVIREGHNASTFFNPKIHLNRKGIYQVDNWRELIFKVCGESKLWIGDKHTPNELCYPVSFEGKEIGYVYESGLELVQKTKGYVYLGENDENWTNGKVYYLNPGKSIKDIRAFTDDRGNINGWGAHNSAFFLPVNDIAK